MKGLSRIMQRILIVALLLLDNWGGSFAQDVTNDSVPAARNSTGKVKVYAIQIAASKVFIEPAFFNEKLGIRDSIRYFQKDGWYKYIIGKYASNQEATSKLPGLSFDAFVTYYHEDRGQSGDSLPFNGNDTVLTGREQILPDTTSLLTNDSIRRLMYLTKVTEADSVFNVAKDLIRARSLYHEAVLLDPEKNYPKDQIVEIDRQIKAQPINLIKRIPQAIYGILFFIGVMIVVLFIVLVLRSHRKRVDKQKQKIREGYQDTIAEYIFTEQEGSTIQLPDLDSKLKKQLLIDQIMQLYANLAGEISEKLRKLYLELGLDNESIRKVRSNQWHIRAKGFRELARMNIQAVNSEIERCLNSPNEVLRMEAQLAMIRLSSEDPLKFLDILKQPFTAWEQLHVYDLIQRFQISPPDFSRWLDSSNESVIVFSIRMIRAFRQESAFDKLKVLLDHPCYEIREETFMTLGELGNPEGLVLLRNRYETESEPGRLEILKAIGKIPDDANIEFLKSVRDQSIDLRLQAADALARIESYGIKGIENLLQGPDEDMQAIARHILENKIRR